MKRSRKVRRAAVCLSDKHILAMSILLGILLGLAVVFAGRFSSRSMTGSLCSACSGMSNEADRQACFPGCTPDPVQNGNSGGTSGGTCGQQPSWPDCERFSCTNGNWNCDQMKSGSNGGSNGNYSGGSQMTKEQCLATCPNMAEPQKGYCISGCNAMGTGSTGGSTYSSGTNGTSGTSGASGTNGTSGTPAAPGGYVDQMTGKTPKQMCMDGCASNPGMCKICDCMEPKSGSCVASSGGNSSMYPAAGECTAKCTVGNMPGATPEQLNACMQACGSPASGSMGSTGSYPGGGSGAGGGDRCFFSATWKRADGSQTGGSIACKADKTDCHEYSESGPVVSSDKIVGGIASIGSPSSCYKSSGGSQWSSNGGGTTGTSYWSQELKKSIPVSTKADCDALAVTNKEEIKWCYMALPGAVGNGGQGTSWSSGMSMTPASCKAGCTVGNMPNATAAQLDACMKGCDNMGSTNGGGAQGNMDGPQMPCTFPNGKILYCKSPNVGCSEKPGDRILSSTEVGATGSNCTFSSGGTQWSSSAAAWSSSGNQGSNDCTITPQCPKNVGCMAPVFKCDSKECMGNPTCHPVGGGNGNGNDGGQYNNLSAAKMQLLWPLQEFKRQVNQDIPMRAKQNGVDIASDVDPFARAVDAAMACVNGAQTMETLNACPSTKELDQKVQLIWSKIQAGGVNSQFQGILQDMQKMDSVSAQMGRPSALEDILKKLGSVVMTAKQAMQNPTATPDQTRAAMDQIYGLQSGFWQMAQGVQAKNDQGYVGYENVNVAGQCDMIRKKMDAAGNNYADASKLQDIYATCIKQAQGAVTGQGFDQNQYTKMQNQYDTYGKEQYAGNACDMADKVMQEASYGIGTEAPMMLKKISKNAGAVAKLTSLISTAKDMLGRAQGFRQSNKCDDALRVLDGMQEIGQKADDILSQAGVSFGSTDGAFVDYSQQYDAVAQKVGKGSSVDAAQLVKHMEKKGYSGQELALVKTLSPEFLDDLLSFSKNSDTNIVQAAANADVSPTKLEAILGENAKLKEQMAKMQQENSNLKAGVKSIVAQIKDETFNPAVAPKMAALLDKADSLSGQEFKAEHDKLVKESNDANYKTGVDPYKDVHTFEKGHAWFVAAVKSTSDAGLFKGKKDGEFAPNDVANVADVSTVFARALGVDDEDGSPDSALGKRMPSYAKGAVAGLESMDVDPAEVFGKSAPGDAATRIQIARLIAAAYSDSLTEADQSILADYTDLTGLSDDDLAAIALVVSNGIMTGTDGKFDPNGAFNRAQFATVMYRLSALTGDSTGSDTSDADSAAAGPSAKASKAEQEAEMHSAAAEAESSASSIEPTFHMGAVHESDLQMIRALVSQGQQQDYSKLSVDHAMSLQVSIVQGLVKHLEGIQKDGFDKMRKENFPEAYIAKQTKDLQVQLTADEMKKLSEILEKAGQPIR